MARLSDPGTVGIETEGAECPARPTPGVTFAVVVGTAIAGAAGGAAVGYAFKATGGGALVGGLLGVVAGGMVIALKAAEAEACEAVDRVFEEVDRVRERAEDAVRDTTAVGVGIAGGGLLPYLMGLM